MKILRIQNISSMHKKDIHVTEIRDQKPRLDLFMICTWIPINSPCQIGFSTINQITTNAPKVRYKKQQNIKVSFYTYRQKNVITFVSLFFLQDILSHNEEQQLCGHMVMDHTVLKTADVCMLKQYNTNSYINSSTFFKNVPHQLIE